MHDEFSRILRSSVPPSPGSPSRFPARGGDVFGDITPVKHGSPSGRRGKSAGKDYGDRFIPTREPGVNLQAAYQLMPDVDPLTGRELPKKGKRKSGPGTDQDVRKEEVSATFTHLLKNEMFPSPSSRAGSPARPAASPTPKNKRKGLTFVNSHAPNLPTPHTVSSAGTTPLHHHPPPAIAGDRDGGRELSPASTLPPLPMHAPSTPTSGHGRAPGAGPSSAHHRAHQSQVSLTSASRSGTSPPGGRKTAFSPPPSMGPPSPSTPTKKRLLSFQSPSQVRMASLAGSLDDMGHEKYRLSPVGKSSQEVLLSPRKGIRQIARTPFKVLDAPELTDDFYLNLVSWSASNVLGVGLNSCVYLWSAQTSRVTKLCDTSATTTGGEEVLDAVTGLEWTNKGSTLAIGTNRGNVEIWDAEYCRMVRRFEGDHTGRVGCLAWNEHVLSSGSRDRTIVHRDTRIKDANIRRLAGHHKQEICGLRWNVDTNQLASGGNDNKLFIWNNLDARPLWKFGEHRAAVKAIAWSPHQRGLLASGGGTADKKIRFWNSLTGGLVSELDTGSQVCNLMWSKNSNEIVSTHGYSAGTVQNQIHIWKYPSMTQVATLTGHTLRVLYLAMSPDGQTIVTGAGDETLRFWNAFNKAKGERSGTGADEGGLSPFASIR